MAILSTDIPVRSATHLITLRCLACSSQTVLTLPIGEGLSQEAILAKIPAVIVEAAVMEVSLLAVAVMEMRAVAGAAAGADRPAATAVQCSSETGHVMKMKTMTASLTESSGILYLPGVS